MLKLFQSNQMSVLATAFCERNSSPGDPFAPLSVIVQSFGIGQWLKLQLAAAHGVSANVDCVLPATFLWRLYQQLIPETRELSESPFDRNRLIWRIMRLLREQTDRAGPVQQYLAGTGDGDLRLFQLAQELALLFDEYLMYRPEWPLQWEKTGHETRGDEKNIHAPWQAELWRLIIADVPKFQHLHRAALHQQACRLLEKPSIQLPWEHLSIFGLSSMPPLQLQTFEALGQHLDVDIYFMNPCAHYWGDIVSEKDKARRSIKRLLNDSRSLIEEDYLEVGNPILSSVGKQGREYLELLLESDQIQDIEYFEPSEAGSMLAYVKNDILNLTHGGEFGSSVTPQKQSVSDNSIQLHVCHSRLREVEVVHDEILRAIQSDPSMHPGDIIVMMPEIADYAPFIQSVFTDSVPYRLADQSSLEVSTLLNTFLWLMELPACRLGASDVMDLLEVPAVMKQFDLQQEDLETISRWINDAGIRWEISGQDKSDFWQLPPENHNTWLFGLQRLLLGFAMSEDQGPWEGALPYDITPAESELVGKLCHLIDLLAAYRQKLNTAKPMVEWQTLITELIEDFFACSGKEVLEVGQIMQLTEILGNRAQSASYDEPVSHQLVLHALKQDLSASDSRAGFISGGITFATLVPMRSIPFRMVCLMGINDGEYPRDIRPHSFDLVAASPPKKGDRSKRIDDRYLFLEALLSAEDIFYASYIGKGIRDNKDRPPSAVLGDFHEYLTGIFEGFSSVFHSLQPFNRRYYLGDQRASFTRHWFDALKHPPRTSDFIETPLPVELSLECSSIDDLAQFLRHPGAFFLQRRLGVYLNRDDNSLKDVESFDLDGLERYGLSNQALACLVERGDLDRYRQTVLTSGRVMAGPMGEQQLDREVESAINIYEDAKDFLDADPESVNAEIRVGKHTLLLQLNNLYQGHLINYQAGQLRARQLLTVWTQHLAANAAGRKVSTRFIYRGKDDDAENLRLPPVAAPAAKEYLGELLTLFHENLVSPLFLPPEAARTYTQFYDGDVNSALTRVAREWSSASPGAEGSDVYWQRLFNVADALQGRFQDDAMRVWQPLLGAIDDA